MPPRFTAWRPSRLASVRWISKRALLCYAWGDSFSATFIGQGIETELPEVDAFITEIYTVTNGTGQVANAAGNFTVERLLHHIATGKTPGVFNGNIIE
jgi:hypothetical protein